MKSAKQFSIVFVTAPDLKIARALAKAALRKRLVACATLIPRIESHYWWRGKIESSAEVLIVFKTQGSQLSQLEKVILEKHPYDTPEIVAVPMDAGSERYLAWLKESVK